jgi:hypothetical protein
VRDACSGGIHSTNKALSGVCKGARVCRKAPGAVAQGCKVLLPSLRFALCSRASASRGGARTPV